MLESLELAHVRRTIDLCALLPEGLEPSYDFRAVTGRLLVELSQYEVAKGILKSLLLEDDEDTEVWYLFSLCCILLGETEECRDALYTCKALLENANAGNSSLMEHVNALLARRALEEGEKEKFWNPRWWVREDGTAEEAQGAGGGRGGGDITKGAETALSLAPIGIEPPEQALGLPSAGADRLDQNGSVFFLYLAAQHLQRGAAGPCPSEK